MDYSGLLFMDCDFKGDRNCPRIHDNVRSRGKNKALRAYSVDNIVNT